MIKAAARVFLRTGYACASINKVAEEAGVSTRTIYGRHKNKAELFAAVIGLLVEQDAAIGLTLEDLDYLEPRVALVTIGRKIIERACDTDAAALFRIVATEAHRFPELAATMRLRCRAPVVAVIAQYLQRKMDLGVISVCDPARAAALLMQMLCAEVHEYLLFGSAENSPHDFLVQADHVVDLFLMGASPRTVMGTISLME